MRLIFAGSSSFGIPALERLAQDGHTLLVISQPDKAAGRHLHSQPCPLAEFAISKGLELFQPEAINAVESFNRIRDFQPELLITASYGGLVKRELRQLPLLGAINLHPSLLPLYRGATPIQSALLNGEERTGMTIFKLGARLDAGPILAQEQMAIDPNDNFLSLHDKLAELASWMLAELLPALKRGLIQPRPQDNSLATYTAKLDKAFTFIDWNQPAQTVLNKVRAFSPNPGAQTMFRDFPLKIVSARITAVPADGKPGSLTGITRNSGFAVNCRDLQLYIQTLQPAGKKVMTSQAFLLGARLNPSDRLSEPQPQIQREEP